MLVLLVFYCTISTYELRRELADDYVLSPDNGIIFKYEYSVEESGLKESYYYAYYITDKTFGFVQNMEMEMSFLGYKAKSVGKVIYTIDRKDTSIFYIL